MTEWGEITEVAYRDGKRVFEWLIPDFYYLKNQYYTSPAFVVSDSSWYIQIKPQLSNGWLELYLGRQESGAPIFMTFTLRIKRRPDLNDVERTLTHCYDKVEARGYNRFMEIKDILFNVLEKPLFPLTVICEVKCDTSKAKPFVTRAIQTDVTDDGKAKDANLSSLDIKGITLLSDRMKDLLINGTDNDLKISVKDKEFQAHRLILSRRSPVFAMMLTHDTIENNTSTIKIEDCDPDSFDEFLLYVYCGRTENLSPSKAFQLYYLADKYDFPVLKEWCVSHLQLSLSINSICDVVLLAAKHDEKELLDAATDFFAQNMKVILETTEWQIFLSKNPVEANELYIKSLEILLPKKI